MQLNRQQTSFGCHETFPPRFGWLPKSLSALRDNAALFDHPEYAMRSLGVGRNMVNAIHYWLRVCGLIRVDDKLLRITPLGEALLGPDADRYQ